MTLGKHLNYILEILIILNQDKFTIEFDLYK